jgi:hypothetical protein
MLKLRNVSKPALGLICTALVIAGCSGSDNLTNSDTDQSAGGQGTFTPESVVALNLTDTAIVMTGTKTSGGIVTRTSSDFDFPEITSAGTQINMDIPAGPAPDFAARQTISTGTGATLGFGDMVTLKYDMFRWSDGVLMDSSEQYAEALTVPAGDSDSYPIPDYLAKSLLGRSVGDMIQVVLPTGTEDLPTYLSNEDAYVLVVELL